MKQNKFEISKNNINFVQTLQCGQIFSYKIFNDKIIIYSKDKQAKIIEKKSSYTVFCDDIAYWRIFFDINIDYDDIKKKLLKFSVMKAPILFGKGIRILKQDLLETIISFAFSANNRISRIQSSLFKLREMFGENKGEYFAFPTLKHLSKITEQDFLLMGLGYRSKQLVKLIEQLQTFDFEKIKYENTNVIRNKLIELSGVGPKVADCILLFGYGKTDVFPVDTWIAKVYNDFFEKCDNRNKIRELLLKKFGNLSGYAQQYLFYYKRENQMSHKV